VAIGLPLLTSAGFSVSVPFARGTPPWLTHGEASRGRLYVSVPFARGTPPWRCHGQSGRQDVAGFQSPSRGGHLRGWATTRRSRRAQLFQSPSRGGHLRGSGSGKHLEEAFVFQSPSRGGHLRGSSAL